MQETAREVRLKGKRIGVVPTMGALHQGHLSLIRLACHHADYVITTIFVNPTQFSPQEDLERYPRPFEKDVELAGGAGSHCIFAPAVGEMYPPGFETSVMVDHLTAVLEGASRPTHFRGVTTIVTKLLLCTQPDLAVFGQKDGQQVAVIKRMTVDLNLPVEILIGPTIRETDGLALSSRNAYLTPEQRNQAPILYRALRLGEDLISGGERSCAAVLERVHDMITRGSTGAVDYVSIADAGTLDEQVILQSRTRVMVSLAVRFGTTRLIDNVIVPVP